MAASNSNKIEISEIETRLRDLDKKITGTVEGVRSNASKASMAGAAAVIFVIVTAYFLGRRKGKLSSTIVEIRRS
ncbi:MAG: hypothetical protein HKL80_08585 [Acidimicrobiales bacterium]|nr:hypothetical protein [Acidimicrobiales bacterium]